MSYMYQLCVKAIDLGNTPSLNNYSWNSRAYNNYQPNIVIAVCLDETESHDIPLTVYTLMSLDDI